MTEQERFWQKVEKTDTCWIWTGALRDGYGRFVLNGRSAWVQAHRYVLGYHGPLEVDHLCRNRACVRPTHLEVVPKKINIQRIPPYSRGNAEKTACPKGHAYDLTNTRITPSGARACRVCDRNRKRVAA